MKQKILPITMGILFIALLGNTYRMHLDLQESKQVSNVDTERLDFLEHEKESWSKRERQLLDDNAYLVNELNILKAEIELKPKTIIKYKRNEKTANVNKSASDEYNDILTRRYIIE